MGNRVNGPLTRREILEFGACSFATAISSSGSAQTPGASPCIQSVPGTALTYYLVAFDKNGQERPWSDGRICSSKAVEELRQGQVTDVFLFSHGWMGDVTQAKIQYENWIGAMAQCRSDIEAIRRTRSGFKPLLVGIHWPSLPYGNEDLRSSAAASARSAEAAGIADRIVDTRRSRQAIETILAASNQPAPERLPANVVNAFKTLQAEAKLQSRGSAAAPGADVKEFDPEKLYQRLKFDSEPREFAAGATAQDEFKYNMLYMLAVVSFWTMKDRARIVGHTGGRRLLASLQAAVAGRDVRFHLMGHSFGSIVTSSMLWVGRNDGLRIQPVHSLSMIQGALSHWSYTGNAFNTGSPGYFRPLVERKMVAGPIVTTQSVHDTAVRVLYPRAAGVAGQVAMADRNSPTYPEYGGIGIHGIRGDDCSPKDLAVLDLNQSYGFQPGAIYNIDCARVIKTMYPISGAHSDISHPEIGHLVWEAASVDIPQPQTPTPAPIPAPPPTIPQPNGPVRRLIQRWRSE